MEEKNVINKKLAILVYGEFRSFKYIYKTWNFLKNVDYDIFISTWNISSENIFGFPAESETITEEIIKSVDPNIIYNIENDIYGDSPNPEKVVHHWKKLSEMLNNSENNYDNVFIIRTDVVINERFDIINIINNTIDNTIYTCGDVYYYKDIGDWFVEDQCFFGSVDVINKFIDIDKSIEMFYSDNDYNYSKWHSLLAKHIVMCDFSIEILDIDCFIMRYINRFFDCSFSEHVKIAQNNYNPQEVHENGFKDPMEIITDVLYRIITECNINEKLFIFNIK